MNLMQPHLDILVEMSKRQEPFVIATVVETEGSVSAKTGAKAIIDQSGAVVTGWVGGGCAESTVRQTAMECMRDGQTRLVDLDMNDEVLGTGMPCGGAMRVFVEPIHPKLRLWILGHGRIAECLCSLGSTIGLNVIVIDNSVGRDRYPAAERLITDDLDYTALEPAEDDFVVVATQHKGDHQSMKRALSMGVKYVALIASGKRSRLVIDYLRDEGFTDDELARVYAPAGLDIGCRTPEEIALSILGEIVMLRRGGAGVSMRDQLLRDGAIIPQVA